VKARRVDVVVAAFDRFGRSVRHLVETLDLFRHLGIEFVSLREQIDTGSPLGQAVFTIIAAIAQLERSLIAERVRAGLRLQVPLEENAFGAIPTQKGTTSSPTKLPSQSASGRRGAARM
jgi:hypothetical protein